MPMTEQERQILSDRNILNVMAPYGTNQQSWTLLRDYGSITLSDPALVIVKFSAYANAGTNGKLRIKLAGTPIYRIVAASVSAVYGFIVYLAAGTYGITAEGISTAGGGLMVYISDVQIGTTDFYDLQALGWATYAQTVPVTVAARTTDVGAIKNAVFYIHCTAATASANTNFENVGESLTNGVSVTVDGAQLSWDERIQDTTNGVDYACARLAQPFTTGTAHTVAVSKRYANTTVYITIVACPWILPTANAELFDNDFSGNSTITITLNPLFADPTKYAFVGTRRGVSFGDATDFYMSASGTGLLIFSVTYTGFNEKLPIFIRGLGGCIEAVGIDT